MMAKGGAAVDDKSRWERQKKNQDRPWVVSAGGFRFSSEKKNKKES